MAPYNRQAQVGGVIRAELNILVIEVQEATFEQRDAQDLAYYDYYYGGGEYWNDFLFGSGISDDDYPYWNHVEEKWEY